MLCRQSLNGNNSPSQTLGAQVHVSHHETFNVRATEHTYCILCHSTFNILSKALSNRSLQLETQEYGLFLTRWSIKCSCILSFVKSINDLKILTEHTHTHTEKKAINYLIPYIFFLIYNHQKLLQFVNRTGFLCVRKTTEWH